MKVYAVHDVTRAAIRLYVELEAREDGMRLYLRPAHDGHGDSACEVAPGCEPPHYAVFPLYVAERVAAALESPLADESVTLDTWRDFAALVDRVTAPVEAGLPRP